MAEIPKHAIDEITRTNPDLPAAFVSPASVFNAKRWKQARGIEIDFLDVINCREARAGSQLVLERFNILRRALGEGFHPPVIEVLNIADDLMSRRRTLGEESKPNPLHVAADKKSARYSSGHSLWKNEGSS